MAFTQQESEDETDIDFTMAITAHDLRSGKKIAMMGLLGALVLHWDEQ